MIKMLNSSNRYIGDCTSLVSKDIYDSYTSNKWDTYKDLLKNSWLFYK